MPSDILLRNAILITLRPNATAASVLISEGRVLETGRDVPPTGDCEIVDLRGKIVMPGLVDAHSRLCRALSLGLPPAPGGAGDVTGTVLERWRGFEAALTPETLICSAFAGAMEAVRAGTTSVIDLTSAPGAVSGALGRVADVAQTVGLRSVLSYEIGDADGASAREAAVAENRRFARSASGETVAALVGAAAGASGTLRAAGSLAAELRCGVHVAASGAPASPSLADRLAAAGISGPATLIAGGSGLRPADVEKISASGAAFVHCPRADMLAGRPHATAVAGAPRVALGSGGARADMFEEARAAYCRAREAGAPATPSSIAGMLLEGQRLAGDLLGVTLGSFEAGAAADLVVLDYHPNVLVKPETIHEHVLFGMGSHLVESVIIDGRFVLRDRRFPEFDVRELTRLVRRGAQDVRRALEKSGAAGPRAD